MALDQHGALLKMGVIVSQHHLTGRLCWSWLSWFICLSTRKWGQTGGTPHSRTTACKRRGTAYAPASLRLFPAPEAQRSASTEESRSKADVRRRPCGAVLPGSSSHSSSASSLCHSQSTRGNGTISHG